MLAGRPTESVLVADAPPPSQRELKDSLAAELPGLLRYARSIVADEHLAEDLVQQAVVRSLEKLHTYRGESSVATWSHRILHRIAVDHSRRTREIPVDDFATLVEGRWRNADYTVDAAVVVGRAETESEVRDSLLRLPVIYRTAVVLHDMEGLSVPEVAGIQGVSLAAAKQRVRRGRMMMVSALAHGADRTASRRGVPLKCWDARTMVSGYLDDELADGDRTLVERHMANCPTCPALYAGMVASTRAMSGLRDADTVVPDAIARRLRQHGRPAQP